VDGLVQGSHFYSGGLKVQTVGIQDILAAYCGQGYRNVQFREYRQHTCCRALSGMRASYGSAHVFWWHDVVPPCALVSHPNLCSDVPVYVSTLLWSHNFFSLAVVA
jgi:hypothetical protein